MVVPFLDAWVATKREEGGYSKHPDDSGGSTNHGITEKVARAHGYIGQMKLLPIDMARQIAKSQYWDAIHLDSVAGLSRPLASEIFDTGFLCGQGNAVQFLQRALNALNNRGQRYGDIPVDGGMGKLTLWALEQFLAYRGLEGEHVLLICLNSEQYNYLRLLVERREKDETFFYGWVANRVRLTGK